jgi:hypothetical protein
MPEVAWHVTTGRVASGANARDVAAMLIRLGGNADLPTRIGEAGRQWVRDDFTFERFRTEMGAIVRPPFDEVGPL